MRITHPQGSFQGVAPENVFFVANDQQVQLGTGYVMHFFQGEMYPERPCHIFMQMNCQPSCRALLFGALWARADVLRAQTPQLPARLYAQVQPGDTELLQFYESCGMRNDDGEDLFRPMGLTFASVPLADDASQNAFLQRVNNYRIQPITREYLQSWQQQQHFMALGFYRNGQPVCETIITGTGTAATLLMIYTRSDFRRQGMAKNLIGAASAILRDRGVVVLYTHIFRRNRPQVALMRHLGGSFVRTVTALPGMDL